MEIQQEDLIKQVVVFLLVIQLVNKLNSMELLPLAFKQVQHNNKQKLLQSDFQLERELKDQQLSQ
ncbi:MAG: hypothetical protein EBZ69_03150 [Alphaproteobacteria bacterium]|nr:hypothetical protein [Alphaproteobacteria bacterium]